jgi:hypothetical protein
MDNEKLHKKLEIYFNIVTSFFAFQYFTATSGDSSFRFASFGIVDVT